MDGYIYQIYFKGRNEKYVGSTLQSINTRIKQHKYLLNHNKHDNKIMQNIYNKYKGSFYYKILHYFENISNFELRRIEQYYIDTGKFKLNICKKVEMPQSLTKSILQYSLSGDFIKK